MIDNAISPGWIALRLRRMATLRTAIGLGIVLAFLSFYWRVFPGLIRDWYENQTFSYGFLVPVISGYLVWKRRDRLKVISVSPSVWAALPLLIAVVVALVGQAIGDVFSVRVSFIVAAASTVYLLVGREYFKILIFPLSYLALMIPIPYVIIKDLTVYLRYLDAAHAGNILQLIGIPTFIDAYFIHIPNMTLEVADVCSGVSSVFALFALATVYAFFLPVKPAAKVFLSLSAFPFAMLGNLIRIVVIAVLAYKVGPIVFQTTFHWLTGTTVFLLALVMLIAAGEFLRRKYPMVAASESRARSSQRASIRTASPLTTYVSISIFLVIFGFGLLFANFLGNVRVMHLREQLESLGKLDGYIVSTLRSADSYDDPTADAKISLVATDANNDTVEAFVAYRGEQTGGQRLRSPKLIFPDNWNSVWVKPAEIDVIGGNTIRGDWMMTRKADSLELVLYWYQFEQHAFGGEFEFRLRQLKRTLLDRRSDGAVVRLATATTARESAEVAQKRLQAVALRLYPKLVRVLPQ